MNVLITTQGSYGDVYPFVGLGAQLRSRGHHVTLLTNPFFYDLARKYGLDFVPVGTMQDYTQFAENPALFDTRKSISVFFKALIVPGIRPAYERILELIKKDTVIVSSIPVFAGRLIQEKFNIPVITVHNIPMAFKSAHEMPRNGMAPVPDWLPLRLKQLFWWVADKAVIDPLICPELNALRKELGLAPVSRIMTRWGHSPRMVIGLFPSWWAAPQPDWPPETKLTGFPLFTENQEAAIDPDVEAFLEEGDPPVVFMPASLMRHAEDFFDIAVKACLHLGKRAILLSRFAQQIPGALPPGIRHFSYVPLQHILPRVDALIHQGGIGTCALAMLHGVPQLLRPMAYDQFDNAWRLKRLGIGEVIGARNWTTPTLAAKIQAMTTSPEVRKRCQDTARKLTGSNPILETCILIESVGAQDVR